jgi:two-component system nitrogen regulation response regulator GlnG
MEDMIGTSPLMEDLFKAMGRVAASDATVLVLGESGTGKELVARAIHRFSSRASGPFVAVNASAIPGELLESVLFGHEKGAFTGATETRKGKFELAAGGTLFLDEIGDMPTSLQAKILRVLENHEFERVGGQRSLTSDVRIISATHRELWEAVKDGDFREDLYYRLNVVSLRIPPLRERREDIPILARHFLKVFAREEDSEPKNLSDGAMSVLLRPRGLPFWHRKRSFTHPISACPRKASKRKRTRPLTTFSGGGCRRSWRPGAPWRRGTFTSRWCQGWKNPCSNSSWTR